MSCLLYAGTIIIDPLFCNIIKKILHADRSPTFYSDSGTANVCPMDSLI